MSSIAQADWSLVDSWKAHPPYNGATPNKSDVIFSTRFKRDEAPAVAKAFHATRVEWSYSADPSFVQALKGVAPWYGGTLNSTISLKDRAGIARDLDGNAIVAPWMRSWGAQWITTTHPQTKAQLLQLASDYVRIGASSIQIDDPVVQYGTQRWAGDFSETALAGFKSFLEHYPNRQALQDQGLDTPNIDYREYLRQRHGITTAEEYKARQSSLPSTPIWRNYLLSTVEEYYRELRSYLPHATKQRFPLSMNLLLFGPDEKREGFSLAPIADYVIVETKIDNYDLMTLQAATYRALGLGYVPSIQPTERRKNRWAIASLYSLGAQPLVPWDVFIGNGEQKPSRFLPNPEDYADLYGFVREHAPIFDNFEPLVVVGIVAPTSQYRLKETLELVRRLNRASVPFAIVPLGANYPISLDRLKHLRLLITVNPDQEIGAEFLLEIGKAGIPKHTAAELTDQNLQAISPFSEIPSWAQVTLFINTKDFRQLSMHVTPRSPSVTAGEARCGSQAVIVKDLALKTRLGAGGTVYALDGKYPLLTFTTEKGLNLQWTSCANWGIGVLSLVR